MKCCISHTSALLWLTRNPNPREGGARAGRTSLSSMGMPDARQSQLIRDFLQIGTRLPLDVMVASRNARHRVPGVCCHACLIDLPPGSLMPISTPAPDIELYVVCPELVFAQMSLSADRLYTIYCGMSLCSDYRMDPTAAAGVATRQLGDGPLTSSTKIASYLEKVNGLAGKDRALRALPYVLGGSRSPKESGLAMLFGLPPRLGGFSLGDVALNQRLDIPSTPDADGNPHTTARYPDLLITNRDRHGNKRAVAVDYDGFAMHADPHAMARDNRRRNEIQTLDWLRHFTLTTDEVNDFHYLTNFADRLRRALGQRKQPQVKGDPNSPENRERLRQVARARYDVWSRFVAGHRKI